MQWRLCLAEENMLYYTSGVPRCQDGAEGSERSGLTPAGANVRSILAAATLHDRSVVRSP